VKIIVTDYGCHESAFFVTVVVTCGIFFVV